jgi:hypothetical protein
MQNSEMQRPDTNTLNDSKVDTAVILAKGILGAAPFIGSLLAEVVGSIIPRQRVDRITRFVELLEERVRTLESETIQDKMRDEQFVDLLEDGMWQAARSLSDERRGYIASLIKNSIALEDLSHLEEKRLLDILRQLSDPEIIILQSYGFLPGPEQKQFTEKHWNVLYGPTVHTGSTREEIDYAAVHKTYRARLANLGLIRTRYKKPGRNEAPELDPSTGMMKSSGHEITRLGELLLEYLDLPTRWAPREPDE